MLEKKELIKRLNEARALLEATVAGIDPECEIYPGWTIKHLMAHLAGWDDAVIAALRAHLGGEEPGTPAAEGIDVYNSRSVATRTPLQLEQIVREAHLSRQALLEMLDGMETEAYRSQLIFPWGFRGSVEQLVRVFVVHEEEHAEEIQRLIELGKIVKEGS